ncbi:PorT family protein [Flavobacteriales bacterium]|nr:PorT family protein [Flavobacteriales bacterium]
MKKIAVILGLVFFTQFAMSQNKFRFGLKIAPSINWLTPSDTKKFEGNGSALGFGGGLTIEYIISESFSFYSGLELQSEKGKINFQPNDNSTKVYYFMNKDYSFIETTEVDGDYIPEDTSAYQVQLISRAYKNSYVTIPVGIKMKTKEIGYMTYFGEFGLNLAFRTGTKIADEVDYLKDNDAKADIGDITEVNMDKDMQPLRVQLKFGLGAEYKISEGTSVFGGLHYNLGFTNVVKGDSKFLVSPNSTGDNKPVTQNFKAHGVQLTIGVLF